MDTEIEATPAYRHFEDKVLEAKSYQGAVDLLHAEAEEASQPPRKLEATGSAVVLLLERVWARIRADHPELPEVVIITGSGLVGASKWGHFRAEGWKAGPDGARMHELFMAGETLAKGSAQVLQTMLHEGAHTLARVRGLKDTSRQGRWHNKTFLEMAVEMGLEHAGGPADKVHGYSCVVLSGAIEVLYADLLAELDREIHLMCDLPGWLGGQDEGGAGGGGTAGGGERIGTRPKTEDDGPTPRSGNLKAVCGCEKPLSIRLSQRVLDLGVVRCDACSELFATA